MSDKKRLAFFSPLPPTKTGIADYAAELIPLISDEFEIDIYIDEGYTPSPSLSPGARIFPASEFSFRNIKNPYQLIIYQMGNSDYHQYIYPFLLSHPGMMVLHDYNLHHSRLKYFVERKNLTAYSEEIEYCYPGEKGRLLARIVTTGMGSKPLYFRFPYHKLVIDASLMVAVHQPYLVSLLSKGHPEIACSLITMGVAETDSSEEEARRFKKKHHIEDDELVIASFGAATPEKRITSVLKAMKEILKRFPRLRYLVVGKPSEELDVAKEAERLGIGDRVIITGFVLKHEFACYLSLCDIGINLRYPTSYETSATLLRIMMAGKPVLISELPHLADIPDESVIRGSLLNEEESLTDALGKLINDKGLREKMGKKAKEYAERKHSLARMRDDYIETIEKAIALTGKKKIDRSNFPHYLRHWRETLPSELSPVLADFGARIDHLPREILKEIEQIL
jgi:glycosyltransferase involved in cell wall biosynthesis